eukprot:scaffold2.g6992.t1
MLPRPSSHSAAIGPGCAGPAVALPTPAGQDFARGPAHAAQVPSSGSAAFVVDPAALADHRQHTQYPYVTGTSVLGVTYKDGVLLASDMLGARTRRRAARQRDANTTLARRGSYGSTKRYKNFARLARVNDACVVGASGELSDFQYVMRLLQELADDDFCMDDGHHLKPAEASLMDPLWNSLVVGGFYGGRPFLGTVGMIGTNYTDATVATGFGNHLARPIMRERHRADMSEEEATTLLKDCLRVCYYRDKNSINKFQIAKVSAEGVSISEPFALETNWGYKLFQDPTANALGAW